MESKKKCAECCKKTIHVSVISFPLENENLYVWVCSICAKKNGLVREIIFESMEHLLKTICSFFNISIQTLKEGRKGSLGLYAKKIYCHLCYQKKMYNLAQIGKLIGLDHSQVIYHKKSIEDWLSYDHKLKRELHAITILELQKDKVYLLKELLQHVPKNKIEELIFFTKKLTRQSSENHKSNG